MADNRNAFELAGLADCASPDKLDSLGAQFLTLVADSVRETWAGANKVTRRDWQDGDMAHDATDGCVPVYTYDVWRTFVDLAAWQEDVTEYGPIDDMERAAMDALYMIGERLAMQLLAELAAEVDA